VDGTNTVAAATLEYYRRLKGLANSAVAISINSEMAKSLMGVRTIKKERSRVKLMIVGLSLLPIAVVAKPLGEDMERVLPKHLFPSFVRQRYASNPGTVRPTV
jgi:hypothetical protein